MEQAKVIFTLDGVDLAIQCQNKDKMKDICQKYATKINQDINSFLFLYGGNQLNFQLCFNEQASSIDRNTNVMKVLVYKNESEGLVCPKCGEKISLNTEKFNDIILTYNEIRDTIDGIILQMNNMINQNSMENSIKNQLKNMNKMINILYEDIKKNNEKLKNALVEPKYYKSINNNSTNINFSNNNSYNNNNKINPDINNNNLIVINNNKNDKNIQNNNRLKAIKKIQSKEIENIDDSELTIEEMEDPECLNRLNSLYVLNFVQKRCQNIRDKIDGRCPKVLFDKIIQINLKIIVTKEEFDTDVNHYLNSLRESYEHDKKLAKYFKNIYDLKKFNIVYERMQLLVKEMDDIIAKQGKK